MVWVAGMKYPGWLTMMPCGVTKLICCGCWGWGKYGLDAAGAGDGYMVGRAVTKGTAAGIGSCCKLVTYCACCCCIVEKFAIWGVWL